jgi:hypothetical protein
VAIVTGPTRGKVLICCNESMFASPMSVISR